MININIQPTCTPFESSLAMVAIKSLTESSQYLSKLFSVSDFPCMWFGLGVLGMVDETDEKFLGSL